MSSACVQPMTLNLSLRMSAFSMGRREYEYPVKSPGYETKNLHSQIRVKSEKTRERTEEQYEEAHLQVNQELQKSQRQRVSQQREFSRNSKNMKQDRERDIHDRAAISSSK